MVEIDAKVGTPTLAGFRGKYGVWAESTMLALGELGGEPGEMALLDVPVGRRVGVSDDKELPALDAVVHGERGGGWGRDRDNDPPRGTDDAKGSN